MSNSHDFLLELGSEELPPKELTNLVGSLAMHLEKNLRAAELTFDFIRTFATPRRLAVLVSNLLKSQPDKNLEIRGPAVSVAIDANGFPTVAGKKFSENCGVEFAKLDRIENEKGAWLICRTKKVGAKTTELLPSIVAKTIKEISIHRAMKWGCGEFTFVRPLHWIVMLYGSLTIETKIFDVISSNKTYGHRFHYPKPITILEPTHYEMQLSQKGFVIADFVKRREKIHELIMQAVMAKYPGSHALIEEALLNEVAGLVEWPVALVGEFSPHYLELPPEIIITCLEHHQRSFPIINQTKKLIPAFVVVSNIESLDPERLIKGNERVIRARLTDAEFFYRSDLRFTLDSFIEKLKLVVFQTKLGTLYDKTLRLEKLVTSIAQKINANIDYSDRAAHLSKCDLMTSMVGEFPELQGVVGYYYALQQYEPEEVALAIKEQYLPKFAKDSLPTTASGQVLAIADRIDTLVGAFSINKVPTGEKDPLGLRRAAIGIIRIILEKSLALDLKELCELAYNNYESAPENAAAVKQAVDFIIERMRAFAEEQGIKSNVINAVLARKSTKPLDIFKRLDAVSYFLTLPEAEALSSAHKRVNNILNKANINAEIKFNCDLVEEKIEQNLADEIAAKNELIIPLYKERNYREALKILSGIKPVVDEFFDKVMVMAEKEKVRNNRLALLTDLRELFNHVADLSLL